MFRERANALFGMRFCCAAAGDKRVKWPTIGEGIKKCLSSFRDDAPAPHGMTRRARKSPMISVIMSCVSIISVNPKRLAFTMLIMLSQPRENTVSA